MSEAREALKAAATAQQPWAAVALGLAGLGALVALDVVLFAAAGRSYFDWYLHHGAWFGLATSAAALVTGPLQQDAARLSLHPLRYLGVHLQLAGLPLYSGGTLLRSPATAPGARLDRWLTLPFVLAFSAALLAWLLLVVPLQYVVLLLAGAPARLALHSPLTSVASQERGQVQVRMGSVSGPRAGAEWDAGWAPHAMKIAGLCSDALLAALKALLGA
jgi:hypothetical protein